MKRSRLFALLFLPVLAFATACQSRQTVQRETIPFVRQVAADSAGFFSSVVRNYVEGGSRGAVALLGTPGQTLAVAKAFLSSDAYDNIDGRSRPDGLPDFAGEVFQILMDPLYQPYGHFLPSNPDSLRELTVRGVLQCVDTMSFPDPLNARSVVAKLPSKIVVLTDPLQAAYGRFDADTLFKMGGKRLSLMDPVSEMLGIALGETPGVRHLALCSRDPETAEAAFRPAFVERLPSGSTLDILQLEEDASGSPDLRTILRRFTALGRSYKLDALLLDAADADPERLRETLSQIRRYMAEGDQASSALLNPSFRIIGLTESLVSGCYRLMRRENRFTHDIAYPQAEYYQFEESLLGEPVPVRLSDSYVSSIHP